MKILYTILFLFTGLFVFAQADSIGLIEAIRKLDKALVQRDEPVLKILLHKDVSYGHSNGWVQTKADVFNDFKNGKLIYIKIESGNPNILTINKELATARMETKAEGLLNGNAFNLSMYIMQVWVKTKKGWQLFARQSAKL